MIEVEAPDGSVVEFPEGTAPDVMRGAMAKRFGAPKPDYAQEAVSGFVEPLKNAYHTITDEAARSKERNAQPVTSLGGEVRRNLDNLMSVPRMAGAVLGMGAAPVQAFTRPAAAAINQLPMRPYSNAEITLRGGKLGMQPARPLYGQEAQRTIEGGLNTALSAAMPEKGFIPPVRAQPPPVLNVEQLKAAKNLAYQAVDQSGVRYTPAALQRLAVDLKAKRQAAAVSAMRHPKATSMLEDVEKFAATPDTASPTLTQLDQLRQVVRRDVANARDDAEAFHGRHMIGDIDEFVDSATPQDVVSGNAAHGADLLKKARDLNTRARKAEDVSDAVEHSRRVAASTGSGGNANNAARQALRRYRENARNLTPDETSSLDEIIEGSGLQNALRQVGKLSPTGNGLMQAMHMLALVPSHGISGLIGAVGAGAKLGADAMTSKKIEELLRLMSVGGNRAALPKRTLALPSPRDVIGWSEVAQPLASSRDRAKLVP